MPNLIPSDFIPSVYLELNPDVAESFPGVYSAKHYIKYGINEGRIYKYSQIPKGKSVETYIKQLRLNNNSDPEYEKMLVEFCNLTNLSRDEIFKNAKLEYRYFCYRYTNYIRSLHIPNISVGSKLEAVFIEYRCLPNVEFVIRNCIIKLGEDWSHTVICGNLNYDYMKNICNEISENIKVIKTDYDNLDQEGYSMFLCNHVFWNNFSGEKILIYQEDTCMAQSLQSLPWPYLVPSVLPIHREYRISIRNPTFERLSSSAPTHRKCMVC
jgi:hypothetical protein